MRGAVPLLLALFGAAKAECLIAPTGLSVDYWAPKDFAADVLAWVDPAVDPAVRFSWQLAGSARGAAQAKETFCSSARIRGFRRVGRCVYQAPRAAAGLPATFGPQGARAGVR